MGRVKSGAAHLPSLDGGVCCTRKRSTRDHEAAVNGSSHPNVMRWPRLPSREKVRERFKDVVCSGVTVDWTDASEWLRPARQDDGEAGLDDDYAKAMVRTFFDNLSKTPCCYVTAVSGKGGPDAGGDGRKAYLLLSPMIVQTCLWLVCACKVMETTAGREASTQTPPRVRSCPPIPSFSRYPTRKNRGGKYAYLYNTRLRKNS